MLLHVIDLVFSNCLTYLKSVRFDGFCFAKCISLSLTFQLSIQKCDFGAVVLDLFLRPILAFLHSRTC
jgi:hypothetical protein